LGTLIKLNSVYFLEPNIANSEFAAVGFTICTNTTTLTFDLTSDQEKKPSGVKKKGRNLQERTEEDPSPGWTEE